MTPISEQFRELTKGRYGGLQLGPDLQAQGVAASGGTRDPDELAPDAAATRDLDTGPLRAIDLGRVITRAGGPGSG